MVVRCELDVWESLWTDYSGWNVFLFSSLRLPVYLAGRARYVAAAAVAAVAVNLSRAILSAGATGRTDLEASGREASVLQTGGETGPSREKREGETGPGVSEREKEGEMEREGESERGRERDGRHGRRVSKGERERERFE